MPATPIALIREPEGVDLLVAEGHLDRPTVLETAEWLATYRRQHDQSDELERAMNTLRRTSRRADARITAPQ
jgi:glutamine synthetase adenylyltransferase